MLRLLTIFAFLIISVSHLMAQGKSGASIYTGLTSATSKDKLLTPDDHVISGYHVGVDARLFTGTMFFSGGVQYHDLTLFAKPEEEYFSHDESLGLLKVRFGLGFNLHHFTEKIILRAKTFGCFNFNMNYDHDILPSTMVYNDAYAGLIAGLGLDISFIALELEYEKGMINTLSERSDSKLDIWTVSLGFFF